MFSYPRTRLRRNRGTTWSRDLLAETNLTIKDLIQPIFIQDSEIPAEKIPSLPGLFIYNLDLVLDYIKSLYDKGINAIALFPKIDVSLKNPEASLALDPDNIVCRAIQRIKKEIPGIGVIADVALDPYTDHGYDGLLNEKGEVDNDKSLELLGQQALVLARAGADVLAPSDMMDGRIGFIRDLLEKHQYHHLQVFSYSVKFNSSLYGPFREVVGSDKRPKDKSGYFADYRNARAALYEVELDLNEGADAIIIKPGIFYLDIIKEVASRYNLPVIAYQVSGEYALLKSSNPSQEKDLVLESLYAFKRAGARAIITYYADEILDWLR